MKTSVMGPINGPVKRVQFPEFAEIRRICFNRVMIKEFDTARALKVVETLRSAAQKARLSTPNDHSFCKELLAMNDVEWGVVVPLYNGIHAAREGSNIVCERT